MKATMVGGAEHDKILWPVVRPVPVDMVNMFFAGEGAAEGSSGDPSVFAAPPVFDVMSVSADGR